MTNTETYFRTGDTVRVMNLDAVTEQRTRNLLSVGSEADVVDVWMNGSGEEIVKVRLHASLPPFALYEWNLELA